MLLRSFNRATFTPELLVADVLNNTLSRSEMLVATEMLGLVSDVQVSLPAIEKQLYSRNAMTNEAAIRALRLLYVRKECPALDIRIRARLVIIAVSSRSKDLRISAAEALADFVFA